MVFQRSGSDHFSGSGERQPWQEQSLPKRSFRDWTSSSGRASRSEFWLFYLVYITLVYAYQALSGRLPAWLAVGGFGLVLILGCVGIPVSVRRLHDIGKSGLWWLITFIPFGSLLLLLFYLRPSQPGYNDYGPNPYGE